MEGGASIGGAADLQREMPSSPAEEGTALSKITEKRRADREIDPSPVFRRRLLLTAESAAFHLGFTREITVTKAPPTIIERLASDLDLFIALPAIPPDGVGNTKEITGDDGTNTDQIVQPGNNNVTLLNQPGSHNYSDVWQEGEENVAEVKQSGTQARAEVRQTGIGNHALIVQR
jgi:hypothetical protein